MLFLSNAVDLCTGHQRRPASHIKTFGALRHQFAVDQHSGFKPDQFWMLAIRLRELTDVWGSP